jgi:hypothetical protein
MEQAEVSPHAAEGKAARQKEGDESRAPATPVVVETRNWLKPGTALSCF